MKRRLLEVTAADAGCDDSPESQAFFESVMGHRRTNADMAGLAQHLMEQHGGGWCRGIVHRLGNALPESERGPKPPPPEGSTDAAVTTTAARLFEQVGPDAARDLREELARLLFVAGHADAGIRPLLERVLTRRRAR